MDVLVVDDDAGTRLLLRRILERELRCRVAEAEHGQKALDLLTRHEFAFVLLDLQMPVMDGFATLEAIRKLPGRETLPVVMLTAEKGEVAVRRMMALGVSDYLAKPPRPGHISARLARLVSRAQRSSTGPTDPGALPDGGAPDAASTPGAGTGPLRVASLQSELLQAARQVFGVMLATDFVPDGTVPDTEGGQGVEARVLMRTATALEFDLVLTCPEASARAVAVAIAGPESQESPEDVGRALGTMAMMIAIRLTKALRSRGVVPRCEPAASRRLELTPVGEASDDRLLLHVGAPKGVAFRLVFTARPGEPVALSA